MLNIIYWPISAVLWFWHWLLSLVMDPTWGITWILAIVLLTWTLKALMVKPTISQIRSSRKMQEIQPKVQEIRAKYGNDQTKAAQEMQKVYKEFRRSPDGRLPAGLRADSNVRWFVPRAAVLRPHRCGSRWHWTSQW